MAQPPPYDRSYNFNDYQAENPLKPLPADRLDEEFSRVKTTLDAVLQNLKLIQRDDTALANKSVGYDQLKDEIQLGFNPPTDWTANHNYIVRDTVFVDVSIYRCLVSHISSNDFEDDLNAGYWELVVDFASVQTAAIAARDAALQAQADAEAAQQAAEDARDDALLAQSGAESARDAAIGAKDDALLAQSGAESARDVAVVARGDALLAQSGAVQAQADAEAAQQAAEDARDDAIAAKNQAEGLKNDAEAAKNASESARDASVVAQGLAEAAQADAEAAQQAAEDARDDAIAAKNQAVAAKDDAEDARDAAAGSASSALSSASAASASASTAGTHASNASSSASAASSSASAANDAKVAAENARDAAVVAQGLAEAAQAGAEQAQADAEDARDAALQAQADAESARDDAVAARGGAESARDDAVAAKNAAEDAQADAEAAQLAAENARDAAVQAKNDAEGFKDDAESAASDAQDALSTAQSIYANMSGGLTGQFLVKNSNSDYDYGWADLPGGGDMLAYVYDPTGVSGDAFNMDNMVEGSTNLILTAAERADIAANTSARHSHSNKSILDATEQAFTTALKNKLDGIEAGAQVNAVTSVAGKTGAVTLSASDISGAEALAGFRNKIINGNFDIWQRGVTQTSSGYGSADRWRCGHDGYDKVVIQRPFSFGQTEVPGQPKYYMSTSILSAGSSEDDQVYARQCIEGVSTLAGRRATLTFYARSNDSRKLSVEFGQNFGTGGSTLVTGIGVTKFNLTPGWQRFDVVVDLPDITGKMIGTSGDDYVQITFWMGAGSNLDDRTDSLGHQIGRIDIARVSLVEGDATMEDDPFSPRHIEQEWQLCYRYYERVGDGGFTIPPAILSGTIIHRTHYPFKARKRVVPSQTYTLSSGSPATDLATVDYGRLGANGVGSETAVQVVSAEWDAEL